jgi:hypothetical protein
VSSLGPLFKNINQSLLGLFLRVGRDINAIVNTPLSRPHLLPNLLTSPRGESGFNICVLGA